MCTARSVESTTPGAKPLIWFVGARLDESRHRGRRVGVRSVRPRPARVQFASRRRVQHPGRSRPSQQGQRDPAESMKSTRTRRLASASATVRTDDAVRPPRPMTRPRSSGCTRPRRGVRLDVVRAASPATSSGWSTMPRTRWSRACSIMRSAGLSEPSLPASASAVSALGSAALGVSSRCVSGLSGCVGVSLRLSLIGRSLRLSFVVGLGGRLLLRLRRGR